MPRLRPLASVLLLAAMSAAASLAAALPVRVFIGSYGDSLLAADFDPVAGRLAAPAAAIALPRASFLARSADGRFLYAVAEAKVGELHAFAVGADGSLAALNTRSSEGGGACDIALSPDGRLVAAANYGGGSVIVYRIAPDGSLGDKVALFQHAHAADVFPGRQKKPHAHGVTWSPDGRVLLVPDLGGDRVYLYARDLAADALAPAAWLDVPAGSGPRHATFSPDARHLYVVNELANTVSFFAYDSAASAPAFRLVETVSTLPPEGFPGATKTAEIAVHPAGHTVYASNRGLDTIAVFSRDAADGRLALRGLVPSPAHPRHFTLSPDGRWLVAAGMDDDRVAVFAVDAKTGDLAPHGDAITAAKPVCVRF